MLIQHSHLKFLNIRSKLLINVRKARHTQRKNRTNCVLRDTPALSISPTILNLKYLAIFNFVH